LLRPSDSLEVAAGIYTIVPGTYLHGNVTLFGVSSLFGYIHLPSGVPRISPLVLCICPWSHPYVNVGPTPSLVLSAPQLLPSVIQLHLSLRFVQHEAVLSDTLSSNSSSRFLVAFLGLSRIL
jgi:hypothetical protein